MTINWLFNIRLLDVIIPVFFLVPKTLYDGFGGDRFVRGGRPEYKHTGRGNSVSLNRVGRFVFAVSHFYVSLSFSRYLPARRIFCVSPGNKLWPPHHPSCASLIIVMCHISCRYLKNCVFCVHVQTLWLSTRFTPFWVAVAKFWLQ